MPARRAGGATGAISFRNEATGETRRAGLLLGALVIAFAVLHGFCPSWYLGGRFGHRGFVELVRAVAVLLGVAADRMSPRGRRALFGACLAATSLTIRLMWGYRRRSLPFEHADGPLY